MRFLLRNGASSRKQRLFACACCRSRWDELSDPRCRAAVEISESVADGILTENELSEAYKAAYPARVREESFTGNKWSPELAASLRDYALSGVVGHETGTLAGGPEEARHLLRCIFGNPFRPATLDPLWLAWNTSTVTKLAQAIYDGRDFDRLPILADALEEAGCDNKDILSHCRGRGKHVRGCWVVDLLLGKS